MNRGRHRAHLFTGGILTLVAGERLVNHLWILDIVTSEVAIDADPVHLPTVGEFILADDGDVVLRLTRHDTGTTSGADVEVDRHRPALPAILVFGPGALEIGVVRASFFDLRLYLGGIRVETGIHDPNKLADFPLFLIELQVTHEILGTHRIVVLGRRQGVVPLATRNTDGGISCPNRIGISQGVGVESDPIRNLVQGRLSRKSPGRSIRDQSAISKSHSDAVSVLSW